MDALAISANATMGTPSPAMSVVIISVRRPARVITEDTLAVTSSDAGVTQSPASRQFARMILVLKPSLLMAMSAHLQSITTILVFTVSSVVLEKTRTAFLTCHVPVLTGQMCHALLNP